jgi:hypothetical protein
MAEREIKIITLSTVWFKQERVLGAVGWPNVDDSGG